VLGGSTALVVHALTKWARSSSSTPRLSAPIAEMRPHEVGAYYLYPSPTLL
jgi:hypothetical protein